MSVFRELTARSVRPSERRTKWFAHENLHVYGGNLAVSDLDRHKFMEEYRYPGDRILVVDNGVDQGHHASGLVSVPERAPLDRQPFTGIRYHGALRRQPPHGNGQGCRERPHLLTAATVSCVPLISGSGTKYNVLDPMSPGMPLIFSSLVAERPEMDEGEMADAIVQPISDPEKACSTAQRSRDLVERRYAWEADLPRLDSWLDQNAGAPHVL